MVTSHTPCKLMQSRILSLVDWYSFSTGTGIQTVCYKQKETSICTCTIQFSKQKFQTHLKSLINTPAGIALRAGLFTWREGALANRTTRLEGLKHSPPLHATHLTGTESGLHELSLERPLSTTNITTDQGNFFPSYFSFLHEHWPILCLISSHWLSFCLADNTGTW